MRELPHGLKIATVWMLLGLGLFFGVSAWQARQERTRFEIAGAEVRIERARDGHYHWPGRVEGQPVDFLVDTGASGTTLPLDLARRLGLRELGPVQTQTAGGTVRGVVVLGTLELQGGVRVERLQMVALPDLAKPLLGMDVLGRLTWQQQGGVLRFDLGGAR
jgi:aspartyl protease family protein